MLVLVCASIIFKVLNALGYMLKLNYLPSYYLVQKK